MFRLRFVLACVLALLAPRLCAQDNLLPLEKLAPFAATFDGDKIVEGRGPAFPWFATKWQKDAAGFASYGPLPGRDGEGLTLWSDARHGPNFWLTPQPIAPGSYRLRFSARSVGEAPWRLIVKLIDIDASLVEIAAPPQSIGSSSAAGAHTFRFAAAPEWRDIAVDFTVRGEGARFNLDLGLSAPGGREAPLLARDLHLSQTASVNNAEVRRASETAARARSERQLRDFYGALAGTVVSVSGDKLRLRVSQVFPYTRLDQPAALVGREFTIHAPPARFTGTLREIANLRATTPPRDQALAYFASLRPGATLELGVYGDLSGGEAKLMRLPGPTSLVPRAELPLHLGARIDESAVRRTLHVSAASGDDSRDGSSPERALATLERAFELARPILDSGTGLRIRVAPGVYRPASTLRLTDYAERHTSTLAPLSPAGREATLVIEGERPDSVFIRGSVAAGFEPATWTLHDREKRIYRRAWTHDFGTRSEGYYKAAVRDVRLHRRELLAVNGRLLEQVLLEDYEWIDPSGARFEANIDLLVAGGAKPEGRTGYIYKGFRDPSATLQPGQFGVAVKDAGLADHPHPDTIFLRLPEGVETLDGALVEVGMLSTILRIQDKSNLVLRNLVFEHAASHWNAYYEKAALDTNPWAGFSDSRNWLFENLRFRHNRGHGAALFWLRNVTIRGCDFTDNGHLGLRPSFVNEFVMEDCRVDRNNTLGRVTNTWIHSTGGLDFTGQNSVFRRVTFNDNYARGFRSDYGLEDVLFEDCEVARNTGIGGVFHEIEYGPVTWRGSRIVDNGGQQGFGLLAVNRVTLEDCVLSGNGGGQLEFYISPKRYRHLEMLPLGWFKTVEKQKGYDHVGIADDAFAPRGLIEGFTLRRSTLAARGEDHLIGKFQRVGDAPGYVRMLKAPDFVLEGNTYWHPTRREVFEIGGDHGPRRFTDLEGWKKFTGKDQDSVWRAP
jgi:hypothetical protein